MAISVGIQVLSLFVETAIPRLLLLHSFQELLICLLLDLYIVGVDNSFGSHSLISSSLVYSFRPPPPVYCTGLYKSRIYSNVFIFPALRPAP
ncbi:hypothetical protein F4774DRAFT_36097 [Daldinia eschscholtzii]|nr:hypothetical protein F4774DRAFT_36097 [Daldinia eschscholtzii]